MRNYQLHHRHAHLLESDHECSECGVCFYSRHSFQMHRCVPRRRRVNIKKREVLAARMREKMQSTSEPYFVFVDSDNHVVEYAGNNEVDVKDVSLEHSFHTNADSTGPNEADLNNSVDRLGNEDAGGSGFLQNDPFQLSESSAVLSCLPQCERELLHSATATLEALSPELEIDVCCTLELQDDAVRIEQSSAVLYDKDHSLLADASDEKVPAENCIVSEDANEQKHFSTDVEPAKSDGADDSGKSQQWPMATSLGDGRLQCNVCRKELRVGNYYPHMRRVHKMVSRSRPITWKVCDRCGYQCLDNYKLRRHILKHTRYGTFTGFCV